MSAKYFAYGSNMLDDVMREEAPANRFLGVARLEGFRPAFTRRSIRTGTGVADVVPEEGATVWGALYELGDDDFERLDRKEGNGWAYRRIPILVQRLGSDTAEEALTYTVIDKQSSEVPPGLDYLETVIRGAQKRGLPQSYIRYFEAWRPRAVGARIPDVRPL